MKLQGISWLVQVAISKAPIALEITQDKDEATGKPRIVVVQKTLARVVEDHRVLDWVEIEPSHLLFGELRTKARITALSDLEDAYLARGWEPELEEVIEVWVEGSGWTSWQAWGFELIGAIDTKFEKLLLDGAKSE